jgi:hypothetical protein
MIANATNATTPSPTPPSRLSYTPGGKLRRFSPAILILILLFGQAIFNESLTRIEERNRSVIVAEPVAKQPELYKVLSFGQLFSATDWIWIASLTGTDISKPKEQAHTNFFYDIDLVTELDPLFAEVYVAGANLLAVVQNDGEGAKTILEKGEKFIKDDLPSLPASYRQAYWQRSWQIPQLLGYVYLFELNDMPSASKYFQEAADISGAPRYLPKLAKRLRQPNGEYEVGLHLLDFMIRGAQDETVIEALEKKKHNLEVGQFLHDVNLKFANYLSRRPGVNVGQAWNAFRKTFGISEEDPWGGKLIIESTTPPKVISTTPHKRVFGLD